MPSGYSPPPKVSSALPARPPPWPFPKLTLLSQTIAANQDPAGLGSCASSRFFHHPKGLEYLLPTAKRCSYPSRIGRLRMHMESIPRNHELSIDPARHESK